MTEIINGGHDTTASSITNGMFMLTQHPAQFDRLKADPSLVPSAVEEVLRFRSPVQLSLTRRTTDDVEIAGVTIPRGSTVVVALAGADREPGKFEDPDTFDIGRSPNKHLSFGNGGHFCLGAHLAACRARSCVRPDRPPPAPAPSDDRRRGPDVENDNARDGAGSPPGGLVVSDCSSPSAGGRPRRRDARGCRGVAGASWRLPPARACWSRSSGG